MAEAPNKRTNIFAQNLKAARLSSGCSQEEFSRISGIGKGKYAKIEGGHAEPSFALLKLFSRLTSQSMDDLIGGNEDAEAPLAEDFDLPFADQEKNSKIKSCWWWKTNPLHQVVEVWHLNGRAPYMGKVPRSVGTTRWERVGADPKIEEKWRRHLDDLNAHRPFDGFVYEAVNRAGEKDLISLSGNPGFDRDGTFVGYTGYAFRTARPKKTPRSPCGVGV